MANFLNMDVGSLFNKKNEEQRKGVLDIENEQIIKSAPVETMFYDLNPDKKPISNIPNNTESNPSSVASGVQAQNPFTTTQTNPNTGSMKEIQPSPSAVPATPIPNTTSSPTLSNSVQMGKKSNTGKILAIIFSIIIVLALAGAGYYFLVLNKNSPTEESPAEFEIPELPVPVQTPIVPPVEPDIPEAPMPNYLNFDFENSSSTQIIETLNASVTEMKASGETKAKEYVLADLQNNPISFLNFASKIGLTFPTEIMSTFSDYFTFFIYNDSPNAGIGLAINLKDELQFKSLLLPQEKELFTFLDPIFLIRPTKAIDKSIVIFNDGKHNDASVRYCNLTDNGVSIDYSIFEGKFIFGTTRFTLQAILDILSTQ